MQPGRVPSIDSPLLCELCGIPNPPNSTSGAHGPPASPASRAGGCADDTIRHSVSTRGVIPAGQLIARSVHMQNQASRSYPLLPLATHSCLRTLLADALTLDLRSIGVSLSSLCLFSATRSELLGRTRRAQHSQLLGLARMASIIGRSHQDCAPDSLLLHSAACLHCTSPQIHSMLTTSWSVSGSA